MDEQAPSRRYWILALLLVLPLVVSAGVVAWILSTGETPHENAPAQVQPPLLGGRGMPLKPPPEPDNTPEPETPPDETPPEETEPEAEPDDSERKIDILIGRLKHATREGKRADRESAHAALAKSRPSERVNERLLFALENEPGAWVRIEFFKALHGKEAAQRWALRAYDDRAAQFMGTNEMLASGEMEEIAMYLHTLLPLLFDGLTRDERLMALLRNLVDTEKPQWLLLPVFRQLLELHRADRPASKFTTDRESVMGSLSDQFKRLLERATAPMEARQLAFWLWVESLPEWDTALLELQQGPLSAYLPILLQGFQHRAVESSTPVAEHPWVAANGEKIAQLCAQMLARKADAEVVRMLIRVISEREVPKAREMLEAGLARKDEFYPDWLTALGRMSAGAEDLQRLAAAANDPSAQIAQGAVEGLRLSTLLGADEELQRILEQGANIGVKSQALGALLDRARDREQMLERYLDPAREDALRAVAVAFVPIKNVERLRRIVEDDPAARVRQSALTRLGELKDVRLLGWMLSIKNNDPSIVLRTQARRYADELEEIKRGR